MSHDTGHEAHTCHWSVPTMLMPWPYWMSAADRPWSCWNPHAIMILSSTEGCRKCPMWTPRRQLHGQPGTIPPEGGIRLPPGR